MSEPKIAILGSGANGASIGADLIRDGLDVTLIEQWPAHVEAMRAGGLTIEMPETTLHVKPRTMHLCEVATLKRPFDVVLLLMKAYDTRWATQLIEPYLAADGVVAGVQNGMTTDTIAEVVGAHRTMGTVIEISSTMYEPGLVHRHSGPARSWFAVGALTDEAAHHEERVADILGHSGTVARVDDILATKWMKLVSNSTVLVTTAILGAPMLDALAVDGMRELMIRAGQEALATGLALGHPILPIFGLQPSEISRPETVVETLLDRLYAGFVLPGATTTVLQDWTKGRHSEVDDLNGHIVAAGSRTGVPTPVNSSVVEVAHRIERGELAPGLDNLVVLLELISERDRA
ncbi:ketopantoate reductase family protein [Lacisediminihabitans profunda]|uniref:2-dehydropantoate 2-reductase n=1 Tax=Lacisediminihabitans profunda TaxID=2594790 RepID=A0A5C8UME9_9MICO|nr:2-dehydropantoate 2-reductase [Lacisediminihabitans profunda]TXN29370.1 2-dehydropantoate 2-reductase [Lacisediminihabitans profunda]